jgi:hypothetical protein
LLVSAVILLAIAWSGRGRWGRAPQRMLTTIAVAGLVSGALAAIIAALFGGVSFAGLGLIFGGVVALGGLIVPAMRTPV